MAGCDHRRRVVSEGGRINGRRAQLIESGFDSDFLAVGNEIRRGGGDNVFFWDVC